MAMVMVMVTTVNTNDGDVQVSPENYQGGKRFGELKRRQIDSLQSVNEEFLSHGDYDVDMEQLEKYALRFCEYDINGDGVLDLMDLK